MVFGAVVAATIFPSALPTSHHSFIHLNIQVNPYPSTSTRFSLPRGSRHAKSASCFMSRANRAQPAWIVEDDMIADNYPSSADAIYLESRKTPDRPRLVCPHCGNQLVLILPMSPENFKFLVKSFSALHEMCASRRVFERSSQ